MSEMSTMSPEYMLTRLASEDKVAAVGAVEISFLGQSGSTLCVFFGMAVYTHQDIVFLMLIFISLPSSFFWLLDALGSL